jgi:hypothetical protein
VDCVWVVWLTGDVEGVDLVEGQGERRRGFAGGGVGGGYRGVREEGPVRGGGEAGQSDGCAVRGTHRERGAWRGSLLLTFWLVVARARRRKRRRAFEARHGVKIT